MIEWLRGLVGLLRPHGERESAGESAPGESDAPSDERTEAATGLFRCLNCDTVYVAVEMEACRACHSDLREVPSTLAGTR